MRFSTILFLVLTTSLSAQKPVTSPWKLEVTCDRASSVYHLGEKVACTIKLTKDGLPVNDAEVTWTFSKDGVAPFENGKARLKGGVATAEWSLNEAGFLQCRAAFRETPQSAPITALAGAAVAPEAIKPSLPMPDDFEAFWATQKKKLAAVPVNARLNNQKSPSPKVEVFDVQADCVGAPVSAYFARPTGAKPKSLPAILFVHGAGVGGSSLAGAATWAGNGALSMNMNAHGIENGRAPEFYKALQEGVLKDYRYQGRDNRETCYFLGMFLRLVRAVDFLTAQTEWNGREVIVYGSSQGGFQAFAAAGIDERVTHFCAGVPAGCDHTGVAAGRVNGWPKLVPNLPDGKPDPKVLETARYFDCVNFAAHARARGCRVTVGFIDTTCPPTSVYAAYNALRIPKEIFNDVKSGHANSAAASKFMQDFALKVIKDGARP